MLKVSLNPGAGEGGTGGSVWAERCLVWLSRFSVLLFLQHICRRFGVGWWELLQRGWWPSPVSSYSSPFSQAGVKCCCSCCGVWLLDVFWCHPPIQVLSSAPLSLRVTGGATGEVIIVQSHTLLGVDFGQLCDVCVPQLLV